jgi:hypothetical protein
MTFTYTTLKQAIIDSTEERGTEFSDFLDAVAFQIVNTKLSQRLDSLGLVSVAYTSLVTANPYIARPDGMRALRSFNILVEGRRQPLQYKTDEFLLAYWPDRTSIGTPKYYANWSDDHFLIAPADADGREVELEYEVDPSILSSATPSNWYTKYASAALYAGMMAEAYKFMKNWAAADHWTAEFNTEIDLLLQAAARARQDDTATPEGPPTNNKGGPG